MNSRDPRKCPSTFTACREHESSLSTGSREASTSSSTRTHAHRLLCGLQGRSFPFCIEGRANAQEVTAAGEPPPTAPMEPPGSACHRYSASSACRRDRCQPIVIFRSRHWLSARPSLPTRTTLSPHPLTTHRYWVADTLPRVPNRTRFPQLDRSCVLRSSRCDPAVPTSVSGRIFQISGARRR